MSYGAVSCSLIMKIASLNGHYLQLQLPLELAPEYTLPEEYFSSIQTGYSYIPSTCNTKCTTTESVDHPGFTKLRNELELSGHIITQRNYINGDQVLKRFKLNEHWFNKNDKFPCACAFHPRREK